jgi:glycine/D-amino acid oxidase-like deaminating enzyme
MDSGIRSSTADVIVVGGGIVGTSAAAFLAGAGARVLLVEREGLASGASGANSGVVQHPFDPILAGLYRETLSLYRDLTAADAGFRLADAPAGMLFVSRDESAVRAVEATLGATFPELGAAIVGGWDLERLDPAVGPGLWACRVDIGYPVAPAASTYAYATLAERRGVELRLGREASLVLDGDAATGVVVDGRVLSAGSVLVAAGPGTCALVDPGGRWRPIRPLWGVVVEADLPVTPRHVLEEAGIDEAIGAHPVRAAGGRAIEGGGTDQAGAAGAGDPADWGDPVGEPGDPVVTPGGSAPEGGPHGSTPEVEFSIVPQAVTSAVGSTFLADEPDPAAWMEQILVGAARFVPSVADAPIRGTRACARPQSADGRPLIGRVPGRRNLYVCSGHGPWGISTGPASARLVADRVLGRGPSIPAELDPARFGPPDA